MAYLATVMINLTIGVHGKKGAKFSKLSDHMPEWLQQEPKEQSPEEMKQILLEVARQQNERMRRLKKRKGE